LSLCGPSHHCCAVLNVSLLQSFLSQKCAFESATRTLLAYSDGPRRLLMSNVTIRARWLLCLNRPRHRAVLCLDTIKTLARHTVLRDSQSALQRLIRSFAGTCKQAQHHSISLPDAHQGLCDSHHVSTRFTRAITQRQHLLVLSLAMPSYTVGVAGHVGDHANRQESSGIRCQLQVACKHATIIGAILGTLCAARGCWCPSPCGDQAQTRSGWDARR
jgi:hypothetical protein